MFVNLLTSIILWGYEKYSLFFKNRNYKIIYRSLEYSIDPDEEDYIVSGEFWYKESKYWSHYNVNHYADITNVDMSKHTIPKNVTKTIVCTKYYYNNRIYKYITEGVEHSWPPRDDSTGIFLPITRACLMNDDCEVVRDVTEKIKRYAGPRNNFYGEEIPIRDIFTYDEMTLTKEYPYLIITTALGQVKGFKTQCDSVSFVAK